MSIHILHLSRTDPLIEAADVGSRHFDKDDWGVDLLSFDALETMFGQAFELDPFASPTNARCERFFSQYAYPGSSAVDAFSVSWDNEKMYLCPPVGKIFECMEENMCFHQLQQSTDPTSLAFLQFLASFIQRWQPPVMTCLHSESFSATYPFRDFLRLHHEWM